MATVAVAAAPPERAVCAPVGGRVRAPPMLLCGWDPRADWAPVRASGPAVLGRGMPGPPRGVFAAEPGREPRALLAPPVDCAGGGSPVPVVRRVGFGVGVNQGGEVEKYGNVVCGERGKGGMRRGQKARRARCRESRGMCRGVKDRGTRGVVRVARAIAHRKAPPTSSNRHR